MTSGAGQTTPRLVELAPAKINLSLQVLGRRPDGYHQLDSLVAFARPPAADRISLDAGAELALEISGPGADLLATASAGSNLIVRAAAAAAQRWPGIRLGMFRLEKNLPVAAGIGGGSADAAAALRLIRRLNGDLASDVDWMEIAASIGADVPVCLVSRFARMSGLGERVEVMPPLPSVWAVLANPRVPLETAPVFKALAAPPLDATPAPAPPPVLHDLRALLDHLSARPNDLEPVAMSLCPDIDLVRDALARLDGVLLARMSGSGPTCFGLFATEVAANAGARTLRSQHPDWWIAAAQLA